MSFLSKLFLEPITSPASALPSEAEKIFAYLESLLNDKKVATEELDHYHHLHTESPEKQHEAYPALYTALEQIIAKNKPPVVKQTYSPETLRAEIARSANLSLLDEAFRLIFLPPGPQSVYLGQMAARSLATYITESIGVNQLLEAVASLDPSVLWRPVTDPAGIQWDATRDDLLSQPEDQVITNYRALNTALYHEVKQSLGDKVASDVMQKIFLPIKHRYDYDLISRFLLMLPSDVLEDERITFLSRQELENRIRQATADLVLERDRAKAIVSSMGEGVIVVDEQQRVISLNAVAERLLHTTGPQALSLKRETLYTLYNQAAVLPVAQWPITVTLTTREPVTITPEDDYFFETTDHTRFPVALTTTALIKGDQVAGVVMVFRDITREKEATALIEQQVEERTHELMEARARLLASINSLKLGFIITQGVDHLVVANYSAVRLLKLEKSVGEVTLDEIVETLHASVQLRHELEKCFASQQPTEFTDISFKDLFIRLYISPIMLDSQAIGCTILIEDVTEALILERSKDEFFSIASHELRTPLTAIRGYTDLLKEMYGPRLADGQFDHITKNIEEGSRRMINLVNDFLNMSGLEQGKILFKKESFDLRELLKEAVQELLPLAQEKNLALQMNNADILLPLVYADKDRLRQVVFNLIGNALKFTEQGSITLSAESHSNFVEVSIQDTGKGIGAQNQHLLFRKFQQAGANILTRDTSNGTGLGLYISRMIIEGMGGTISLKYSAPGEGSIFTFSVPTFVEAGANVANPS